ncbi:MAG: AEC family transporter [Treponema sp.]|nr:AEC family transporter [Treponema sp.]
MYVLVAKQLLTMAIIGLGGFIFAKIFKVNESERKFLSKLLMYFINPTMVLNSFNREFDSQKLALLGIVVILSLIIHGMMIVLGILTTKQKIDRLAIAFTNCGFIGIPLIRGVFGDEGIIFLMGYLAVFNILVWTYGYHQLSGTSNIIKVITNPNIIAVALGIVIFCMPFTLPEVVARPLSLVADTNTAISMVLVGVLIADFHPSESKEVFPRLAKMTLLRLVICSLLNVVILFAAYKLIGGITGGMTDLRMIIFVVLICSMCPVATSIPSLACLFDQDAAYASLTVSITSILCIITLPGFVALAELIIK